MKHIILVLALAVGSISFAQVKSEKQTATKLEKTTATSDKNQTTAVNIDADKSNTSDRVNRLAEEFGLSKDQQKKLESILIKHDDVVKENQGNDDKINEHNKEMEKEFRSILTPEQQKKFDEKQKNTEVKQSNVEQKQVKSASPTVTKKATLQRQKVEPTDAKTKESN